MAAVGEFESVSIILGENSPLIKLVSKTDTAARAYGIKTEVITKRISGDTGFDTVTFNRASKSPDRFVFRAFTMSPSIHARCNRVYFTTTCRA